MFAYHLEILLNVVKAVLNTLVAISIMIYLGAPQLRISLGRLVLKSNSCKKTAGI
jgi:hypothetical protein